MPTTDNISGVQEGLTAEVISSEEATEEYYGPYEGYQMADALLSLRDSAAAKSDENEEVYDEQRNWRGYQGEGEEQIYQPHHHQEVSNSKSVSSLPKVTQLFSAEITRGRKLDTFGIIFL